MRQERFTPKPTDDTGRHFYLKPWPKKINRGKKGLFLSSQKGVDHRKDEQARQVDAGPNPRNVG